MTRYITETLGLLAMLLAAGGFVIFAAACLGAL